MKVYLNELVWDRTGFFGSILGKCLLAARLPSGADYEMYFFICFFFMSCLFKSVEGGKVLLKASITCTEN